TNPLSTLQQRFACARLAQSHLSKSLFRLFPQRSPLWLLTTAACGGLRLTPDCRSRRANLHLSYSCAAPCGPALLRDTRPKAGDLRCAPCRQLSNVLRTCPSNGRPSST